MAEDDNEIRIQERESASGDRRWRVFTAVESDYDGFGRTAEEALLAFIRANTRPRNENI